jgi:hypothetical protein
MGDGLAKGSQAWDAIYASSATAGWSKTGRGCEQYRERRRLEEAGKRKQINQGRSSF